MHLLPGCVGPLPDLDMHVALPAASLPAESVLWFCGVLFSVFVVFVFVFNVKKFFTQVILMSKRKQTEANIRKYKP